MPISEERKIALKAAVSEALLAAEQRAHDIIDALEPNHSLVDLANAIHEDSKSFGALHEPTTIAARAIVIKAIWILSNSADEAKIDLEIYERNKNKQDKRNSTGV